MDALGERVHQLILFVVVLIKQQMQLIKRMPSNLPVMFFVEIAKRNCVCEDLIQVLRTRGARRRLGGLFGSRL